MEAQHPDSPLPPKPPLPTKPVLEWYGAAKDKRDLLCIAALNRGWDFRQEPGSMAETECTEAEYAEAIAEARATYGAALRKVKRPSACVVLAHPKLLLACIIRRPDGAEAENLLRIMKDPSVSEEETVVRLRDDFVRRLLWPAEGSEQLARVMEEAPLAFNQVFPAMVQEAAGSTEFAKKRG